MLITLEVRPSPLIFWKESLDMGSLEGRKLVSCGIHRIKVIATGIEVPQSLGNYNL